MVNISKIDWVMIMAIAGGIGAGILSIGELRGIVNTLDPEVIKEKKDIAIQEIKQAGIEARKSIKNSVETPNLETEEIVSGQKKLEDSYNDMLSRLSDLSDEIKSLHDKVANIKEAKGSPVSANSNYADRFSTLDSEIANLKKEYNVINEKFGTLSVVGKNDYVDIKDLAENNRKDIANIEKKLEKIKNSDVTGSMEGYYKLPITPEIGKPFSPPLKKTIALCDGPFYLTYNGFRNKKSYPDTIRYRVNYESRFDDQQVVPGNMSTFKGDDHSLMLRYMQLSDDGENPIFIFECK